MGWLKKLAEAGLAELAELAELAVSELAPGMAELAEADRRASHFQILRISIFWILGARFVLGADPEK